MADGHAPTCPLVCCISADDPAVAHGYEPEPYGSGVCICGRSDDHAIHWPDLERPYEQVLDADERGGH